MVVIATYFYGNPSSGTGQPRVQNRPPPIRIRSYLKSPPLDESPDGTTEFSVKLPTTPFMNEVGRSSSRPASPARGHSHSRSASGRVPSASYFSKIQRDQ